MVAKLVTAVIITTLLMLLITGAMGEGQEGAIIVGSRPHGLPFETPIALTPSAYDFFHPGVVPPRARSVRRAPPRRAPRPRGSGARWTRGGRGPTRRWRRLARPPRSRGGGGGAAEGTRGSARAASPGPRWAPRPPRSRARGRRTWWCGAARTSGAPKATTR
ncbi:hypothetical protein ACMD2_00543 [Ananas comosus]|uniref:Uncharacterized protein n=1 Tax=Ananas comosus TaxID=4615 RepID=A0A199UFX9_ANACO|nr:hypothetical protein ACMD2_00543 [Ananas comosus]